MHKYTFNVFQNASIILNCFCRIWHAFELHHIIRLDKITKSSLPIR